MFSQQHSNILYNQRIETDHFDYSIQNNENNNNNNNNNNKTNNDSPSKVTPNPTGTETQSRPGITSSLKTYKIPLLPTMHSSWISGNYEYPTCFIVPASNSFHTPTPTKNTQNSQTSQNTQDPQCPLCFQHFP